MSNVINLKRYESLQLNPNYPSHLRTHYDSKNKLGWFLMRGAPRPSVTVQLLAEVDAYFSQVKQEMKVSGGKKYDFLVLSSDIDGVFSLGGDLELFNQLIVKRDKQGLIDYATQCSSLIYQYYTHLGESLTTISLIQGDALGGGFESALSANVVIAEKGTKMGLPEVMFNLFPGMGAFPLLSRKLGQSKAEKIILSGQIYSAEQMFDMGVVDILAEPGDGELAVYRYTKQCRRSSNSFQSMRAVKDRCNQINYEELIDVANIWADAALNLTSKDLRTMGRLVRCQSNRAIEA